MNATDRTRMDEMTGEAFTPPAQVAQSMEVRHMTRCRAGFEWVRNPCDHPVSDGAQAFHSGGLSFAGGIGAAFEGQPDRKDFSMTNRPALNPLAVEIAATQAVLFAMIKGNLPHDRQRADWILDDMLATIRSQAVVAVSARMTAAQAREAQQAILAVCTQIIGAMKSTAGGVQ